MTKAQRAQRNYEKARRALQEAAGVDSWGSSHYYTGGLGTTGHDATGRPREAKPMRPGEFVVRYGVEPSPAEIQAYMKSVGMTSGNPSRRKNDRLASPSDRFAAMATNPAGAQAAPAAPAGPSLFERLVMDTQRQENEANRQNQLRYDQVLASQDALYDRTMGEVDNWGNVQRQLNDEKAAETLSAIKADMAARGIANSNVTPAFQQRNARDLALTQQDLSERKSARRIGYDTALTQDQNAFIERRNDIGPDQNSLLQLALEYGRSGNGTGTLPQVQQQATVKPRYKPLRDVPIVGGVSPYQAQAMASNMQGNFLGQIGNAMGMMRPTPGGPAYTSNRYPTPRTPEEYAAIQSHLNKPQASGGGLTSNSHPVGLMGNLAGLAYNAAPGLKKAVGGAVYSAGDMMLEAHRALEQYNYDSLSKFQRSNPALFNKNLPGASAIFNGLYDAVTPVWKAGRYIAQ